MRDTFRRIASADREKLERFFEKRGTRLCNDSAGAALLWALAGPDPSDWAARGDLALLLAIHAAAAATGEAWCLHPDSDAFPLAWILASSSGPAPDATAALAPAAPPAALPERFDPILAFPELPAGGFLDNLWAAAAPQ